MLSSFPLRHLAIASLIAGISIEVSLAASFAKVVEAPQVYYDSGYQVSVLDHCTEKGYVRPINPIRKVCLEHARGERVSYSQCQDQYKREYFLSKPIILVDQIELADGELFTKVNRVKTTGHNVEVYQGNRLKEAYSFDIPNCTEQMISEFNPLLHTHKASAKEALVYGALSQQGIHLIDGESWTLEQVAMGRGYKEERSKDLKGVHGSAELWYSSPNCLSGEIVPFEVGPYLEALGGELTGSGRALGGELTGSGREVDSGKLFVRMNVDQMTFNDLTFRDRRLFGIPHQLEPFVNGDREIPKSLINISCLKR